LPKPPFGLLAISIPGSGSRRASETMRNKDFWRRERAVVFFLTAALPVFGQRDGGLSGSKHRVFSEFLKFFDLNQQLGKNPGSGTPIAVVMPASDG
jgi:hypothetical protein